MDVFINKAAERIRKELKEEQLPEFEKLLGELKDQIKGAADRAEQGPERGGRGDRGGNRLDRIMEELSGSAEEKAILREKIKAILDAEDKYREDTRKVRSTLDEVLRAGKAAEEIQGKLGEMRELKKKFDAELKALRDDLVPLLSFEQEAKLVIHRVLE
jgi:DNA repair exonuclease SbcCD ATPase subunit